MANIVKLMLSFVLTVLFSLGIWEFFSPEQNRCEMTYMYQTPIYIPIRMPSVLMTKFPQYRLFVYGEAEYAASLEEALFTGVPVLFIPGNGGSYKQVRSLASVAYRKTLDGKKKIHFNFFTVDLNEEFGALHGQFLERQTEYVSKIVHLILDLYGRASHPPKSVILIGHSMGGLVARAVVSLPQVTTAVVPLIVTQATPHSKPVIMADSTMQHFYEKVNVYWAMERDFNLKDMVLISVGGGKNDYQVSPSHCHTDLADVSTLSTNVPACWLTTDHQSIVWCKQLVLATVRALFEIVDSETGILIKNRHKIVDIFKYHLVTKSSGKLHRTSFHPRSMTFDPEAYWTETNRRQHSFVAPSVNRKTYLMFPLFVDNPLYQRLTATAAGVDNYDWVMACKVDDVHNKTKYCTKGENLSQKSVKIPGKKKMIELDITELAKDGHSHIIVYIAPTDDPVTVFVDIHSHNQRNLVLEAPPLLASLLPQTLVDNTPDKALTLSLALKGLREPWQVYQLSLIPLGTCPKGSLSSRLFIEKTGHEMTQHASGRGLNVTVEIGVSWTSEGESGTEVAGSEGSIPNLQFRLNPACVYTISIHSSISGIFRRMTQMYATHFPSYIAMFLLITLSKQVQSLSEEGGIVPSLFSVLVSLTPLGFVPFVKIISLLLRQVEFADDFYLLSKHGENMAMLPVILFFAALPITLIMCFLIWGSIIVAGNAAHSFVVRILGRTFTANDTATELALSAASRFPVVVAAALVAIGYGTCGVLGVALGAAFYFVQICKMYEDYIQAVLMSVLPGGIQQKGGSMSTINFHLTILMLVILSVVLNVPSMVAWGKMFSYSANLKDDTTLMFSVVILISLAVIWNKKVPNKQQKYNRPVGYAIHAIAIATVLFASVNVYRVPQFVALALLILALQQTLAPMAMTVPEGHEEKEGTSDANAKAHMTQVNGRDSLETKEEISKENVVNGSETSASDTE